MATYADEGTRLAARKASRRRWYEANKQAQNDARAARRAASPEMRERERRAAAAYDAEHREARNAAARARRAADPERARAISRASHERTDPAVLRARKKAWESKNPGKRRVYEAKRVGIIAEGTLTAVEWTAILVEFGHACAYCRGGGVPLEVDHLTPLSRGGRHEAANVVPACRSCNATKGSRTLLESFMVLDGGPR